MKLKDLKGNLGGIRVKTPNGVIGVWKSQWNKGVWLSNGDSTRIYPQFVNDLKDCLEWEVTEDKINCHIRTDYYSINNK